MMPRDDLGETNHPYLRAIMSHQSCGDVSLPSRLFSVSCQSFGSADFYFDSSSYFFFCLLDKGITLPHHEDFSVTLRVRL
jgi:hypothetical protein